MDWLTIFLHVNVMQMDRGRIHIPQIHMPQIHIPQVQDLTKNMFQQYC